MSLRHHRLLAYSATPTSFLNELNAPLFAGRGGKDPVAAMVGQQYSGLAARG